MKRITLNKKIIFFDGDGTLWYPIKTKYSEKPHWIYKDKNVQDYHEHLILTPDVIEVLKKLKERGIITVILSTHPHEPSKAVVLLNKKVEYFKLGEFFTEVHATREYFLSKGEHIVEILKRLKIPKSKALMIGDSYIWDYKSARSIGVEALLIESTYSKVDKRIKIIKKLTDLLKYL